MEKLPTNHDKMSVSVEKCNTFNFQIKIGPGDNANLVLLAQNFLILFFTSIYFRNEKKNFQISLQKPHLMAE